MDEYRRRCWLRSGVLRVAFYTLLLLLSQLDMGWGKEAVQTPPRLQLLANEMAGFSNFIFKPSFPWVDTEQVATTSALPRRGSLVFPDDAPTTNQTADSSWLPARTHRKERDLCATRATNKKPRQGHKIVAHGVSRGFTSAPSPPAPSPRSSGGGGLRGRRPSLSQGSRPGPQSAGPPGLRARAAWEFQRVAQSVG